MKVIQQKNVYFIDLSKRIYRGFVETTINRHGGENSIVYKSRRLSIQSVEIIAGSKHVDVPYKTNNVCKAIDQHEALFSKSMWRDVCSECTFTVDVPEEMIEEEIVVRITYGMDADNDSIEFYKPVCADDKHMEVVATNRLFDSSSIFPSVQTSLRYKWELVYIIPTNEDVRVISPGTFRSMSEEAEINLYSYVVDMAHSGHLNFCVGTFGSHEILIGDDKKMVYVPKGMSNYKESVKEFCADLESLIKYTEYFLQRDYPFRALEVAFVYGDANKVYGQGTSFLSISSLTPSNDIEPAFMLKRIVGDIISSQVFYFYFSVVDKVDFWISEGMKGYFSDYCARHFLGNSEFIYELKKDRDYVFENDISEYALFDKRRTLTSMTDKFFKTKSKVFFHLLEGNLSKAFMEKILNYTLKKKDDVNAEYTHEFVKLVKDVTGKDLKFLFDAYVFRPGAVKVKVRFSVNKKNNRVDFSVEQAATSILVNGNRCVSGPMMICSYEMEGVFEHIFTLDKDNHFYYHPRTKKKKKPEEEEEVMPLLWIRADPKGEHLAKVIVEQPDYMFIEQLLDKNVIGQMEALENLSVRPSTQICEILERVLENTHVFYKVRIDILYILCRTISGDHYGFQRLIQYFVKKYCVQTSTIVKPNDFSFISYFVQKHLVNALSLTDPFVFREYSGRTVGSASIVCAFIINILKFNDNSFNSYSDSWYISSAIEGLSLSLCSMSYEEFYSRAGYNAGLQKVGKERRNKMKDEINELFLDEMSVVNNQESEMTNRLQSNRSSNKVNENKDSEAIEHGRNALNLNNKHGNKHTELSGTVRNADNRSRDEEVSGNSDPKDDLDYLKASISEIERFRILDMVFPSHCNLVTQACVYALGRLSVFGVISLKKETLMDLCKYPNFIGVRIAAFEVLVSLFHDDQDVIEMVLEDIRNGTFTIKNTLLDLLVNFGLSSRMGLKNILKMKRKQIFELIKINNGNTKVIEKLCSLVYIIEDMDMSEERYKELYKEFYEKTLAIGIPTVTVDIESEKKKRGYISIRLNNMDEIKRILLETQYIIKLPFVKEKIDVDAKIHTKKEQKKRSELNVSSKRSKKNIQFKNTEAVDVNKYSDGYDKNSCAEVKSLENIVEAGANIKIKIPTGLKIKVKIPKE
ncbi:hypothetical protein CWI42_040070 [Ordospora colligata]|uniref:Transcription initiation factor TFIID subunit 2 n=1 Tax=Ordospora colligata OC4 TaxID=1354746 RepID=A0A0B2ULH3_9MICR|nr:uncharacterized protein M896_040070 [Ordospora colligata OC4]KHN69815.1 hypothetical protein M896_040070 [Ordospora colligata OC4]TBU15985.1 hypothetical protein CWI41_040070 [Ordospora colligata]TBU16198.1 hypothetical protein CWI40_040070 [Ordospora colligata]TBU18902.1 hypothetical protein CWI42_040070 [Ordospora colligata]